MAWLHNFVHMMQYHLGQHVRHTLPLDLLWQLQLNSRLIHVLWNDSIPRPWLESLEQKAMNKFLRCFLSDIAHQVKLLAETKKFDSQTRNYSLLSHNSKTHQLVGFILSGVQHMHHVHDASQYQLAYDVMATFKYLESDYSQLHHSYLAS